MQEVKKRKLIVSIMISFSGLFVGALLLWFSNNVNIFFTNEQIYNLLTTVGHLVNNFIK
jgi:cytochrome c-type biogenesis protein CcmE